jgi:hypothetical protein
VVHAAPIPAAIPQEEKEQWTGWAKQTHNQFTTNAIRNRTHKQYYKYNAVTKKIIPMFQHHNVTTSVRQPRNRRNRRAHTKANEVAYRLPHPLAEYNEKSLKNMFKQSEFAKMHDSAEQARIGEFVQLDIAPQVLYVKIIRGAQEQAIRILTARLYEHIQSAVTRLFIKKSTRTGRYTYSLWLSAKVLQGMSESGLYERIAKLTHNMKRAVTIIVKQNISSGSIQELWKKKHSLI